MNTLYMTLMRLNALQNTASDRLALVEAVDSAYKSVTTASDAELDPQKVLNTISTHLQAPRFKSVRQLDPAAMPVLVHDAQKGFALVRGLNARQQWVIERFDDEEKKWSEEALEGKPQGVFFRGLAAKPFEAHRSPVFRIITNELWRSKSIFTEIFIGSIVINMIALASSFFSMQVYDRVVPTGAVQTLLALTMGLMIAILFELLLKHLRSHFYKALIDSVDQRLARATYMRFLQIRLDQLPRSVGSLASQLRGYESIRSFLTAVTTQMAVDAPFAIFFLILIGILGGPWLAAIPLAFLFLSLAMGFYFKSKSDRLAEVVYQASNFKTGLLVESIEGAETIKSGQSGWRMLQRWMNSTDEARTSELDMRTVTENAQHITAAFQQISYALLVATGALMVSRGEVTMGGLIACSILSGRVLTPIAGLPALYLQWSTTKVSVKMLNSLWSLQDDHHGVETPVMPDTIHGAYRFENVTASYGGARLAFSCPQLQIRSGEKIGILGPIGAGKTTLLRLLSGMYAPQQGRIFLDDLDLGHIHKGVLSEHIGYLQQDGRLFAGSLRENLTLGLVIPDDSRILAAAERTGLLQSVIQSHPEGLQQKIAEGGMGLSGGQKQLVNLTRVVLREPSIWLLDEPTSNVDKATEQRIIQMLADTLKPTDTLILVTHKPELLVLVQRLLIVAQNKVALDGPRDEVLKRLQSNTPATKGGPA